MILDNAVSGWHVIRTRSRHEKIVEKYLELNGFPVYLPKLNKHRMNQVSRPPVEWPLFPGYIFVKPRPGQLHALNFIPGTCGLLIYRNKPGILQDKELEAIRKLVTTSIDIDTHTRMVPGDRVRVAFGPLTGVEGVLICLRNHHRLAINTNLLGRAISVEIDREYVQLF